MNRYTDTVISLHCSAIKNITGGQLCFTVEQLNRETAYLVGIAVQHVAQASCTGHHLDLSSKPCTSLPTKLHVVADFN